MTISVFDGHCDTPMELWQKRQHLVNADGHISLQKAKPLHGYMQFFAFCTVWVEDNRTCEERFSAAKTYFLNELSQNSDEIALCKTAADVKRCLQQGRRGAMLSIEGAEAIGCDEDKLPQLYAEGFRMLAPVWNEANALSGSCMTGEGLTERGKAFCRKAQKLGFLLDVSHLSDRGFFDLCDLAEKPIVASHSNSRAVFSHPRNLTDEQFSLICQLGGTAGINLYSEFLTPDAKATLDDVYRHIDRFLSLGGDGHVALGGDLDGCDVLPDGFSQVSDYIRLYDYLQARGYSQKTLANLFSDALLEVLKCTT